MSEARAFPGGSAASPTAIPETPDRGAAVPPAQHLPQRGHPTHLPNVQRDNQPIILFVTVSTKDRRPILASDRAHKALLYAWPNARQYRVGRYVLMPDHLHLFCSPAVRDAENVKRWTAYWKRLVSIELNDMQPIWQRDCWDTQLRNAAYYIEKWEYVAQNPVRRNLIQRSEDWPYQGCLNELRW
jgi:putative transposase